MAAAGAGNEDPTSRAGVFATTHWSVVLAAADEQSPGSLRALEDLGRTYWQPLYAFVRRQGHTAPDAQDLVQGFFLRLIDKHRLEKADPTRGRFRTFLLTALKHYLSDERDRAQAIRRGGQAIFVPVDDDTAEQRYQAELATHLTPEEIFDRHWATALLESVLAKLKAEVTVAGKGAVFDALSGQLMGEDGSDSYADVGRRFNLTEAAVKMVVLRLRQRYRELLRLEISQTVDSPEAVDAEIAHLIAALRCPAEPP